MNSAGQAKPPLKKQISVGPPSASKPATNENDDPLSLVGQKIEEKKKEEDPVNEFFENRIIKPLPDYSWNPELKELAQTIQREIINHNP